MPRRPYLSKSMFMAGMQCHKRLWLRVHEPDCATAAPDTGTQVFLDQGRRVGELARTYVPGGTLVDLPYHALEERSELTRRLLDRRVPAIYEASFLAGRAFASVDILERRRGRFHLVEVKSSTEVKEDHVADVAYQLHVLRSAGIPVSKAELMHLDSECAYPHLEGLFVRKDLTGEVEPLRDEVSAEIAGQLRMLSRGVPDVPIGAQCVSPEKCPFIGRCWGELPDHHVSTLFCARHGGTELMARGYSTVAELSREGLTAVQARQREAVRTGRTIVEPGLGRALEVFREPLAFLDFEAVSLAIPVWNGCHPYDPVPAQFSCHRPVGRGRVAHHEWIAESPADPRPEMARRVVEACRGARSVVAYFATYEKRCLDILIAAVPELAGELRAIQAALVDPLPIVRNHVYHPEFRGSFSLKRVLPALVPGPGYEELEVAEGLTASVELERLMFHGDSMSRDERRHLRDELLRYCALDTLGLMKLVEKLGELSRNGIPSVRRRTGR